MGLKDTLRNQKTEVEQQNKQKEEQKFGAIRAKLDQLVNRKEQLQARLGSLDVEYDKLKSLRGVVRNLRRPVSEVAREFKDVLKQKDIHSTGDLMRAEEYAEEPEIVAYKGAENAARDQVSTIRQSKDSISGTEGPDSPRLTKAQTQEMLRQQIFEADSEYQELFDQTPEGQQQKVDQLQQRVVQRMAKRLPDAYRHLIERYSGGDLVSAEDMEDAKVYGESAIKGAIIKNLENSVDQETTKSKAKAGIDIILSDLEVINNSLNTYSEKGKKQVEEVRELQAAAKRHLQDQIKANPKAFQKLKEYFGNRLTEDDAADKYLQYIQGIIGREDLSSEGLSEFIRTSTQKSNPSNNEILVAGRSTHFNGGHYTEQTQIPNPYYTQNRIDRAKLLYKEIAEASPTYVLSPDAMIDFISERLSAHDAEIRSLPEAQQADKPKIFISQKTVEFLNRHHFVDALKEARQRSDEFDAKGKKIKGSIPGKINAAWANRELTDFESYNPHYYELINQQEFKTKITEWQKALASERVKLQHRSGERVVLVRSRGGREKGMFLEDTEQYDQSRLMGKEKTAAEEKLQQLAHRMEFKSRESKGFLGLKEKKIAEEMNAMHNEEQQLRQKIKDLAQKLSQYQNHSSPALNNLRDIIEESKFGAGQEQHAETTLGNIISGLDSYLNEQAGQQLNPEEQETLNSFNLLKKRAAEAQKQVEGLSR